MASPENNVINLRPETPMVEPERPCWAVYEHWVCNEKGRKLRPGVYWHSFKRAATEQDAEGDTGDRPITDEWIASPVTVIARTTNSDDGSDRRQQSGAVVRRQLILDSSGRIAARHAT